MVWENGRYLGWRHLGAKFLVSAKLGFWLDSIRNKWRGVRGVRTAALSVCLDTNKRVGNQVGCEQFGLKSLQFLRLQFRCTVGPSLELRGSIFWCWPVDEVVFGRAGLLGPEAILPEAIRGLGSAQ